LNNYLNVFLRSIIEAITEFLPVSSTGHLFLFSNFFPFENIGENAVAFEDLFDIFIQSGAILSVLFLYFKLLYGKFLSAFSFLTKKTTDREGFDFWLSICLGFIPVLVLGFLAKGFLDTIKARPDLLLILGFTWTVGGVVMIMVERKFAKNDQPEPEAFTCPGVKRSILIGIFQCIALVPGVSRSAATIITARFLGVSKKDSAEFSFFLALPVLIAASFYKLYKHRHILVGDTDKVILLAVGFILSFIFCLFIIRWFISFVKKYSFSVFGYYRVALGLTVIAYFYAR
jgi:undecaprenyl-diphosphatase